MKTEQYWTVLGFGFSPISVIKIDFFKDFLMIALLQNIIYSTTFNIVLFKLSWSSFVAQDENRCKLCFCGS